MLPVEKWWCCSRGAVVLQASCRECCARDVWGKESLENAEDVTETPTRQTFSLEQLQLRWTRTSFRDRSQAALITMSGVTGKRKREDAARNPSALKKKAAAQPEVNGTRRKAAIVDPKASGPKPGSKTSARTNGTPHESSPERLCLQVVTGSYERVLHGFAASIPTSLLRETTDKSQPASSEVTYSDTFLFAPHASSIRCLAVSPPTESDKRFLATGGSDERINVYSISTEPPSKSRKHATPSLSKSTVSENSSNRSLGSLVHHDRAVNQLHFPAKGKLFSAAEDNTVAISRTRDWTVLSSIKAPIPKGQGRPSGDTAGPGEVPTGVNDFAIHPSQKLMLSVSRGEKCMRLWNLMTGKKAGVLSFERELLLQAGEGKYSSGEGRRLLWDEEGENYVVGFERGAALFGIDSKPKAVIKPTPPTKMHQMHVVPSFPGSSLLALSTEDGRVLFYDLSIQPAEESNAKTLPASKCIAQLGGRTAGVQGRIKDFQLVLLPSSKDAAQEFMVVTAGSDGAVRFWSLTHDELVSPEASNGTPEKSAPQQIGRLISTNETGNRITCLGAFIMDGEPGSSATNEDVVDQGTEAESSSEED